MKEISKWLIGGTGRIVPTAKKDTSNIMDMLQELKYSQYSTNAANVEKKPLLEGKNMFVILAKKVEK